MADLKANMEILCLTNALLQVYVREHSQRLYVEYKRDFTIIQLRQRHRTVQHKESFIAQTMERRMLGI